jgi:hypothetical protein
MPNSTAAMIKDIAKANNIEIRNTSVECLLFVYGLTFRKSAEILEKRVETISKISLERIRKAFDEIHITFGHLKEEGKLKGKNYSGVEQISPLMETVIGRLIAALSIHDLTKPDPQGRPEKLEARSKALYLCGEHLSICRRLVSEINSKIAWWCKEEQARDCLNRRTAPPATPTDMNKEKQRRQKLA